MHSENELNMRILVVDDEQDICEILQYNLETEGYEVTTVNSAEEALERMENWKLKNENLPDLLLLDVMMGEMSGFQMAARLKADEKTADIPIIFITALDTEDDMVKGLNLGADDYIAKPLSMKEVKARVKAVMRRAKKIHTVKPESDDDLNVEPELITYEGLVINPDTKAVTVDGTDVPVTKIEFELLSLLVKKPGKVFSREELLNRCWPSDSYVLDRTVDVNITRLRKKIGQYGKHIKTRFGYGYSFQK